MKVITGDRRCAFKGIHWCQTSNSFSNRIRHIYRYSLHYKEKALDKGLVPLSDTGRCVTMIDTSCNAKKKFGIIHLDISVVRYKFISIYHN